MFRTQPLGDIPTGASAVQHRHHLVATVLDDAHGGLGAGLAELPLGQDQVVAAGLKVHGRCLGSTGAGHSPALGA